MPSPARRRRVRVRPLLPLRVASASRRLPVLIPREGCVGAGAIWRAPGARGRRRLGAEGDGDGAPPPAVSGPEARDASAPEAILHNLGDWIDGATS